MVNHGGERRGADILLDPASGVREEALTTVWNQAGFPFSGVGLAVPGSIAVAPRQQEADHRPDTEGDGDSLIGIFAHDLGRRP